MNKALSHLMNQRKRKTRIALCIRVFALLALASFYIITAVLTNQNGTENTNGMCFVLFRFRQRKFLESGVSGKIGLEFLENSSEITFEVSTPFKIGPLQGPWSIQN